MLISSIRCVLIVKCSSYPQRGALIDGSVGQPCGTKPLSIPAVRRSLP